MGSLRSSWCCGGSPPAQWDLWALQLCFLIFRLVEVEFLKAEDFSQGWNGCTHSKALVWRGSSFWADSYQSSTPLPRSTELLVVLALWWVSVWTQWAWPDHLWFGRSGCDEGGLRVCVCVCVRVVEEWYSIQNKSFSHKASDNGVTDYWCFQTHLEWLWYQFLTKPSSREGRS